MADDDGPKALPDPTDEAARTRRLLEDAQRLGRFGHFVHDLASGETRLSGGLREILELGDLPTPPLDQAGDLIGAEAVEALQTGLASLRPGEHVDLELGAHVGGRPLSLRATLRRGEGTEVLGVIQDITAEKIRRERLLRIDQLATIGALVTGVAHEVSNPLHAIRLNLPLLQRAWDDALRTLETLPGGPPTLAGLPFEEAREALPRMHTQMDQGTERIAELLKGLRHFGRPSRHAEQAVDLNEAIRTTVALTTARQRRATDRFSATLAADLPRVRGNLQDLQQVVAHLLLNALAAVDERDQAVGVATHHRDGQVVLVVHDEGAGMDADTLRKATLPFFTTRRQAGAVGLGLAVADQIVGQHGGRMHLTSTPGRGTTATVVLPALS